MKVPDGDGTSGPADMGLLLNAMPPGPYAGGTEMLRPDPGGECRLRGAEYPTLTVGMMGTELERRGIVRAGAKF
jgi:hypothetical protein